MRCLNTVASPPVLIVAATTIGSDRCGVHGSGRWFPCFVFIKREQRNGRRGWRRGWSGHVFFGGQ